MRTAIPTLLLLPVVLIASTTTLLGAERFPPPELPPEYVEPELTQPPPQADLEGGGVLSLDTYEWINLGLLAAALAVAGWLIYSRRSRVGLIVLGIGAILVFGFYRAGCICPIGAIQNVALGLFDDRPAEARYAVPWFVLGLLGLPLLASLFYGRVFCSSVCPFGAMQDLVLVRPVRVPRSLATVLGLVPFVYLGVGVLLAATGAAFVICRYDPFVGLLRLSGTWILLAAGGGVLVLSMFVGRPYCRFLCPLGAAFRITAPLARRRVTTTPDECIRCRLCEDACPYDAIRPPNDAQAIDRRGGRRRLVLILLGVPILLIGMGWLGSRLSTRLARVHPTVSLAERVALEQQGELPMGASDATDAFMRSGELPEELFARARVLRGRFRTGGWLLGIFLGLVLGASLLGSSVKRTRSDYEPDPGLCVACGRCWASCPVEHRKKRQGELPQIT